MGGTKQATTRSDWSPPRAGVGPSRTDRGWLGSLPGSILLTPLTSVPQHPDPETRDTRGAPKPTWRAAHRSTCARRRGPASAGRTSLVPSPTGGPGAFSTLGAADLSPPPLPRATHTRGDPRRTPQTPPGTRLGPSHHQVKRPNAARPPASRARLPPSMAPSNAPGIARRPSSPPRRARAP